MNAVVGEHSQATSRPVAIVAGVASLIALTSWVAWERLPSDGWRAVVVAIAMAAALALGYLAGRRSVAILHRAIRRALDGHLEPVESSAFPAHGTVIGDYNVLARRLYSLIGEMERSQVSIIGERNRIDAILRSLPCVMLVVDADVRVASSNDRAEALFGLTGAELRGTDLFELLRLDGEGRRLLSEAFLYDQQVSNREIVLEAGASRRHFTLSVTFFRPSADATIPCAVIMLQDVTDYRRLQQLAHQSEKYVAMGQLAGGVAHELNTPLGTILGYAQLLNAGGASEAKRAQYGQAIYSEAKRCARIIDNLLAYARRERCAPETCDVNAVIREVVETIRDCQSNHYPVPIEIDLRDVPSVRGGSGQLDIVLGNLIMNALQAASGSVPEPRVVVASLEEGASVIVTVTDNGPGIPPGLHGRVFDPFFSTKEVDEGTGLGLAISQSIVMSIGATLHCDATFRGGARFVLKLPLAGADRHGDCAVA